MDKAHEEISVDKMDKEHEVIPVDNFQWYRTSWTVTFFGNTWIDYFKVKDQEDTTENELYCRSHLSIANKVTVHQMLLPLTSAPLKKTEFPEGSMLVLTSQRFNKELSIKFSLPEDVEYFYPIPIKTFTPEIMRFSYQGHPMVLCKPSTTKWFHRHFVVEARVLLKGYEVHAINPKEGENYLVLWTHRLAKTSFWYYLFRSTKISYFSINQSTIQHFYSNPATKALEGKYAYDQLKEIHVDPTNLEFWCFASFLNYYVEIQRNLALVSGLSIFFILLGIAQIVGRFLD